MIDYSVEIDMFLGFCCWCTVAALCALSVIIRNIFVTGFYFNRFKPENMLLSPVFGQLSAYFRHQCWRCFIIQSDNNFVLILFYTNILYILQRITSVKTLFMVNTLTPLYYNKLILLNCES